MMKTWRSIILLLAGALSLADGVRAADRSLYERLGGQPAVQAVVSDFVDRILADDRANKWFAHTASSPENTNAYKAKLSEFLCQNTGGPCKYTGRDMIAAHKGRNITDDAFNAVVQDLVASLDKFKVPAKEKRELLDIVGSMKPSIVQK